jgi:hypothetical protein
VESAVQRAVESLGVARVQQELLRHRHIPAAHGLDADAVADGAQPCSDSRSLRAGEQEGDEGGEVLGAPPLGEVVEELEILQGDLPDLPNGRGGHGERARGRKGTEREKQCNARSSAIEGYTVGNGARAAQQVSRL